MCHRGCVEALSRLFFVLLFYFQVNSGPSVASSRRDITPLRHSSAYNTVEYTKYIYNSSLCHSCVTIAFMLELHTVSPFPCCWQG